MSSVVPVLPVQRRRGVVQRDDLPRPLNDRSALTALSTPRPATPWDMQEDNQACQHTLERKEDSPSHEGPPFGSILATGGRSYAQVLHLTSPPDQKRYMGAEGTIP